MRINFQPTLNLPASIADPNLGGKKSAFPLRVLNRLRFENEDAFLAGTLRARPAVTVRLYINYEPGAHEGRRVLHIYSQFV
jgi:hypothetical protein